MNRFNIDELIWLIVLIFMTVSINFLIKSGEINNFVHSDMINYFYISIGVLLVFIVVQFSRIFTLKRKKDFTSKFIPIIFTIVVGIGLFLGVPVIKGIEDSMVWEVTDIEVIEINDHNSYIVEENSTEHIGEIVSFVGYIEKENGEVYVSRNIIKCCQSDKVKIKVKVTNIDEDIKENQWVNILGEVNYDNNVYVKILDSKNIKEPKELYL